MKRYMQVKNVVQWSGQKQQGGRRTHNRGAPRDGPCQPLDKGTDQHLHGSVLSSSNAGLGVTWLANWIAQGSTLKSPGFWVFCARTITFLHQLTLLPMGSLPTADGRLDSPEQPHGEGSCAGAVLPVTQGEKLVMSLVHSTYANRDSTTHQLSWQYAQKVFLLAFWLLITTWL